jgi:hypothetical protein
MVLSILPRAAELYRRQVAEGLEVILARRSRRASSCASGGKIRLEPLPGGGLMVHWNENSVALLRALGSCGSGGRI